MHPRYIKKCRICSSDALTDVVDLGEQFLQGSFVKEGVIDPPRRRLPTRLVRCDVSQVDRGCGLVQLAHTFPPAVLYSNYWYRSGTNQTMRDHLAGIVSEASRILADAWSETPSRRHVLDIGCNDGTLLSSYEKGTRLYGVDPSDIAGTNGLDMTLVNTVFPSAAASEAFKKIKFDVVTSIAMFYDLEDPVGFAREVASVLGENGVWIVEMSYLPLMLAQNSFDTICHEHLEYYSLAALEYIFEAAGLRAFRISLNEINGGSIRCYVCHDQNTLFDTEADRDFLRRIRLREFELALDTPAPYEQFVRRIEVLKQKTKSLLSEIKRRGQRVHVYGASTKGNVLLQWYGLDSIIIEAAADRNTEKVGSRTVGTEIPIISEEESRASRPDYYLVLPWHFRKEFLEREKQTIVSGSKFIFPLPELVVVDAGNYEAILAEWSCGGELDAQDEMLKLLYRLD